MDTYKETHTREIKGFLNKAEIVTKCLICDEVIELDEFEKARAYAGLSIPPKVCTGCKEAVKRLKEGTT